MINNWQKTYQASFPTSEAFLIPSDLSVRSGQDASSNLRSNRVLLMRIASKHSRAQYHTNDKMTFQSLLNNFRVTKKKESGMIVPGSKKVLLSSMRHCEQYVYMKRGTIFLQKKKKIYLKLFNNLILLYRRSYLRKHRG
jgi:hypothetical protein